jgi:hypothetical protein
MSTRWLGHPASCRGPLCASSPLQRAAGSALRSPPSQVNGPTVALVPQLRLQVLFHSSGPALLHGNFADVWLHQYCELGRSLFVGERTRLIKTLSLRNGRWGHTVVTGGGRRVAGARTEESGWSATHCSASECSTRSAKSIRASGSE